MNECYPLEKDDGQDKVESRLIAQDLGLENRSLLQTINTNLSEIESLFGKVTFEMRPSKRSNQKEKVCLLNEGQSLFVSTLVRNTKDSIRIKGKIVDSFLKARKLARDVMQSNKNNVTPLDALKAIVNQLDIQQQFINEQKEINKVLGERVTDVDARITTIDVNYYSVSGYAKKLGTTADKKKAQSIGRAASKLSREQGYKKSEVYDAKYGTIGGYHIDILKQLHHLYK